MKAIEKRLEALERRDPETYVIVVNWDSDPEPAPPGTVVITWEDSVPAYFDPRTLTEAPPDESQP